MIQRRANGKLLLTGEYAILDGALSLAVPTTYGQQLVVEDAPDPQRLYWESQDANGQPWFWGEWLLSNRRLERISISDQTVGEMLETLFAVALTEGADPEKLRAKRIRTKIDFPRNWGLGSSSTLVYLMADYLSVSAYELLDHSFGGSGYDLACAGASGPILFQQRQRVEIPWTPAFSEQMFFVYQGQKQSSRAGIRRYREQSVAKVDIEYISELTYQIIRTDRWEEAAEIFHEHERLIGRMTGQIPIQDQRFSGFPGQIKSLGAWGGDFALALSDVGKNAVATYFNEKGLSTVIKYDEMTFQK